MSISMTEIEKYEFDRSGYIVIKNLLKESDLKNLSDSVDMLEKHALRNLEKPPIGNVSVLNSPALGFTFLVSK